MLFMRTALFLRRLRSISVAAGALATSALMSTSSTAVPARWANLVEASEDLAVVQRAHFINWFYPHTKCRYGRYTWKGKERVGLHQHSKNSGAKPCGPLPLEAKPGTVAPARSCLPGMCGPGQVKLGCAQFKTIGGVPCCVKARCAKLE